jgi:hypothetical protein
MARRTLAQRRLREAAKSSSTSCLLMRRGCDNPPMHRIQQGRGRARPSGARLAALGISGLILAVGASAVAAPDSPRAATSASVCRVPRLSGVVVRVARERAQKAGCRVRLVGTPVTDPNVQTVRVQRPTAGNHSRLVTLWVNPICRGSALRGPGSNEPALTAGPTELISGLYIVGGPLRPRSERRCTFHPGVPGPGTITVRAAASGAILASQTVTGGHLARIPLPPGSYTVEGTFGDATINNHPGRSLPTTVTIPPGKTVRQDVFLSVR